MVISDAEQAQLEASEARLERRLRRIAIKQGLSFQKSRCRVPMAIEYGGYRIIDPNPNWVVAGGDFRMSLYDAETWLTAEVES